MRASRAFPLAVLATFLVSCGSGESASPAELAASTDAISASAVHPGNAGGNKLVKVLTRNLYIGADVVPLILGEIADPAELWEDIQATDYPLRAGALADEIAATSPDVVGLQEATRFDVTLLDAQGAPVGGFTVDYVEILLAELAARGSHYRVVVESALLQVSIPLSPTTLVLVRDRDVILAREDVETANEDWHVFTVLAPLPPLVPGLTSVPRGWTEADVKIRGEWFRFVNAHLEVGEAELAPLQLAQAAELLAALPPDGPVVLVGDFNADPNAASPTYALLGSALDEAVPDGAPPTCCQAPLLDNVASLLGERLDLVLFRGPVTAQWAAAVGDEPALLEEGPPFWASDHAGVLAGLRIWEPRFFALR